MPYIMNNTWKDFRRYAVHYHARNVDRQLPHLITIAHVVPHRVRCTHTVDRLRFRSVCSLGVCSFYHCALPDRLVI